MNDLFPRTKRRREFIVSIWTTYGVPVSGILGLICAIFGTTVAIRTCNVSKRALEINESAKHSLTWKARLVPDFDFILEPSNSSAEVTSLRIFLSKALVEAEPLDYYLIGANNHIRLKSLKDGLDAYLKRQTKVVEREDGALFVSQTLISGVTIGIYTRYIVDGQVYENRSLYIVKTLNRMDAETVGNKPPANVIGAFGLCYFLRGASTKDLQAEVDAEWAKSQPSGKFADGVQR